MSDNSQLMPVLLYHRIIPDETAGSRSKTKDRIEDVTKGEFEAHLQWFKTSGFKSILLADFVGQNKAHKELPEKPFVITFDDGNASDLSTATPLLLKYGFQGEFFIIPAQIGTPGFLTWDDVIQMKNLGMSIQSHTLTHPFLTKLPERELKKELFESKKQLEQVLKSPVEFLSIPGGFSNRKVEEISSQAGYKAICTSQFGLNHVKGNIFRINRIAMKHGRSPNHIASLLNPYSLKSLLMHGTVTCLKGFKSALGASNYHKIRSFLLRHI